MTPATRPVLWSIAATDSGGGAGLSADLRAAEALGVHLCPVVAAITAQHSRAVTCVAPVSPALLDAQLQALADDMPPAALKTGLLGSAATVRQVAAWVDRLRARFGPLPLVVDPVLAASSGASFAEESTLAAYRSELLPRADLVTPNRAEAALLSASLAAHDDPAPALAQALCAGGAAAVCVTGGDTSHEAWPALSLDALCSPHARGWLALPRVATPHTHGSGCTFAAAAAAAMALGFVSADAVVLAKMAATRALARGYAAGLGAGPVAACTGFGLDAALLPVLSFDGPPVPWVPPQARAELPNGLYAIVDSAARVPWMLDQGLRLLQLRIKQPLSPQALRRDIMDALTACRVAGARLVINDHWQLAAELGADAAHLGQEDLAALGADGRTRLAASGLALGVSSHSLWELARARGLAPDYIACGPVWPTTTKRMPWRAQGVHNLAWWCAVAGRPVVAIGGVLSAQQVREAAACGADAVCLVRALDHSRCGTLDEWWGAFEAGHCTPSSPPALPLPALPQQAAALDYRGLNSAR